MRHDFAAFFRRKTGFSLIELLVGFTLISIITGIGFASFVSYSRRQVVIQAAANFKQNLDLAKFNALSSVKTAECSGFDLSAYRVNFCYNGTCIGSGADYEMTAICGGQTLIKGYSLPDNVVALNHAGGTGDCMSITFAILNGNVQGTPCELEITGYNNTVVLSIDTIGNASYK